MWIVYVKERSADDHHSFECPRCGHVHSARYTPAR